MPSKALPPNWRIYCGSIEAELSAGCELCRQNVSVLSPGELIT